MMNMKTVCIGAALLSGAALSQQALAVAFPGPDAFGYTGSEIANNLRDVSATGTILAQNGSGNLGCDDCLSSVIPIGFGFDFYGTTFTDLQVSSNGFLSFSGDTQGCCTGDPIPSVITPNNLIAGLWEDLDPGPTPGQGTVAYELQGAIGSREFIVGFYDVPHWSSGNPVNFEMILREATDGIELQYGAINGDGGTHTIGIENADGTDGLELYRGSNVGQFSNRGFLITAGVPVPAPLALIGVGFVGLGFSRMRAEKH